MNGQRTFATPIRGFWDRIWLAIGWRYLCHSIMLLIVVLCERIPGPHLTDRIISVTPFVPFIARYNYYLWLMAYVPLAAWLWRTNRNRFVEFMYAGGVLSLLRGFTISLTTLGPVRGADINAGKTVSQLFDSWLTLINPYSALTTSAANIYLTKDLFFSGHTSSTFLLWLYLRSHGRVGYMALGAHLFVVTTVFVSHLHYTIDVVGAWAITFSVYVLFEKWFNRGKSVPYQLPK